MEIPSTERKRGGRGISQAMKGGEGGGWSIETKRQGGGEREKGRGREKGKVGEWVRRGGGEVIHSEGRKEDRRWVVGKRMGWGGGEATVHTEGDGRHKNIIPKCVSQNGHPPKCQLSVRWCRVDVGAIREWHLQKCRPPKCQPNRVIRQKKKKKDVSQEQITRQECHPCQRVSLKCHPRQSVSSKSANAGKSAQRSLPRQQRPITSVPQVRQKPLLFSVTTTPTGSRSV